jgi:hypothetical protein
MPMPHSGLVTPDDLADGAGDVVVIMRIEIQPRHLELVSVWSSSEAF